MNVQIERIKDLVIEGSLRDALTLLVDGARNTKHEIESTLLLSRFNKLNKDKNNFVINEEAAQQEFNRITIATLELLSKINNTFFHDEVLYDEPLFFETPREEMTPKQQRVYTQEFEAGKVRHVGWEINMKYPKVRSAISYIVKWRIFKPDGQATPMLSSNFVLQKDWTNSWMADSWGYQNFGGWSTGQYKIELHIGEKLIAKGTFTLR
jgi:hypothetical protein